MRNMITALVLLAAVEAAAQSSATLRGIDVYRSPTFTSERAKTLFQARLREYVTLRNHRRAGTEEKAEAIRRALQAEAARQPGVVFAELTVSEFFTSTDHAMYAMFDVVDESDRGRLAFLPAPKRNLPDPDGALAAWKRYYDAGSALAKRGQMPIDRPDCPGFYCQWAAISPELEAEQKKLVAAAAAKERELRTSLAHDASPDRRAAALFVLAYGSRGERVVEAALNALKDSSPVVRGAGLQVLADVVNHHKQLRVDLDKILPLLDDPSGGVRGKAMGLLLPMTDDDDRRRKMHAAAPRLVALLKLSHPESRDLAFTLLSVISRKSFDRRDEVSWESWAAKAAAGKGD